MKALMKFSVFEGILSETSAIQGRLKIAKTVIEKDQAYSVISAALDLVNELKPELAQEYAKKLENETSPEIIEMVGDIYIEAIHFPHILFEKG